MCMSEFGEAVEMCVPKIQYLLHRIDLKEVVDHPEEVKAVCEMFNNHGNYPHTAKDSDLKRLIWFMIQPIERMEEMLMKAEELVYLYSSINNIRQTQILFMNPKEFATKSQHEQGRDRDFKTNPALEGMLKYLRQEIFGTYTRRRDVEFRERLLEQMDTVTSKSWRKLE